MKKTHETQEKKAPSAQPEVHGEQAEQPEQPESASPAEDKNPLAAEIEQARAEAEDLKRKWYAVTAEYENYRKRTASQSAQRYCEGRADVVSKLFPIADNLERALAACTDEGTKKGIQMVKAAFDKILEEEKIVVIDPVGQPFDAEKHEAIMAADPAEGEESGTVKQVYLKGYEQNGKVLRFAQVIVVK